METELKVIVRGSGMRPYACFAVGMGNRGMVRVWRQSSHVVLPVPLADVFEYEQSLFDDLAIAFDDHDEESLRDLWTRAIHVTSSAIINAEQAAPAPPQ